MKEIYITNDKNFYKNVRKYNNSKKVIHFIYQNCDIIDDSYISNFPNEKIKIQAINALNIKDIKKRYEYIYDTVCKYLDDEFSHKNLCQFQNNQCISVRNNSHCPSSKYGCCYGPKRGLCEHMKNGKCSIKSISCKLFTCRYLKANKVKYPIKEIPLLNYFFNLRQKYILSNSIFKDKAEIISLLLKSK